MPNDWRMTVYDADLSSGPVELPGEAHYFVYAQQTSAFLESGGSEVEIQLGDGAFRKGRTRIRGAGVVWVYEVGPHGREFLKDPAVSIVLSKRVAFDFGPPWLLRADRVESQSGSVTPRHGHRGPGMRRLTHGRLLAEVGDQFERIEAGQAWLETGRDPVIGTNINSGSSAFVRVMVLPIELEGGKTSFMPTTPEDATKPRAVTYRLFGEVVAK